MAKAYVFDATGKEIYDKLKVTEGVDSYEARDSDVVRGSTPRNIERAARPKQKASISRLGGRGLHSRQLDESSWLRIAARKAAGLL